MADVSAVTDCEILIVPRRSLWSLLERRPDLCIDLMLVLCDRLRRTNESLSDLVFSDVPGRVAKAAPVPRREGDQGGGAMSGRVIYIVRSWPRLSQTFIVNEVLALERRGVDLAIFSLVHAVLRPAFVRGRRRKPAGRGIGVRVRRGWMTGSEQSTPGAAGQRGGARRRARWRDARGRPGSM